MVTILRQTTAGVVGCLIGFALAGPVHGSEGGGYVPVSLRDTEVRSIRSTLIDQEFKLHIYLPPGYDDSERLFPVLYLTDSDAYFGFVKSMIANLQFGNLAPALVVVGIAYEEDTQSYLRKRERDLLPVEVANKRGSGKAADFGAFFREELLPFVESEYRVDPEDRTIAGLSAGATFASYILFTAPELFRRYIIVSPYFIFRQEIVLDLEAEYSERHDRLPAHVYTAMGELEPDYARGPWNTFVENLRSRAYPDLELEKEVLAGLSHMDVVFTAYVNGIKSVFADRLKTLKTVPENHAACSGRYDVTINNMQFTVRHDDGRLFMSRSGKYWDELSPVSDTRYEVMQNRDVQISFVADQEGAVARLIIHQAGVDLPAEKVE
jgi:predicted alpha/beta superfamily hydrolase